MKKYIILATLFIFSCTIGKKQAFKNSTDELDFYIDSYDFEQARVFASREKNPPLQKRSDIKKINTSEKCLPALIKCEKENLTLQEVLACLYHTRENCNSTYLTNFGQKRLKQIKNPLIEQKKHFLEGSDPSLRGQCEDGHKWGYFQFKTSQKGFQAFTMNKDFSKLRGEYDSKTICEEKRIKDKHETSNHCYKRFVKENRSIDLVRLDFIHNNERHTLYFNDFEKCQRIFLSGLTYYKETNPSFGGYTSLIEKFSIDKKNSPYSTRVISECSKVKPVACAKHRTGIQFLHQLL